MKNKFKILLFTICFIILLVSSVVHFNRRVQNISLSKSISEMMDVTIRRAEIYELALTEKLKLVQGIANNLDISRNDNEIIAMINRFASTNDSAIGIINKDGRGFVNSGVQILSFQDPQLFSVISDKSGISVPGYDLMTGERVLYIYSRFNNRQGYTGTVFITMGIEELYNSFPMPLYNGDGIFYVIDDQGSIILDSSHISVVEKDSSICDFIGYDEDNEKQKEILLATLASGSAGYSIVDAIGEDIVYAYGMIESTDHWHVVSIVQKSILLASAKAILEHSILLSWIISLIVLGIICFFLFAGKRLRQEKEILEKIDDVTGEINFTTFRELAKTLIMEEKNREYALLTFDIKDFRYINEIYGFEEGDLLLKYIAQQISTCNWNVFGFSRFSADNFVCLLEFHDEATLVDQFHDFVKQINYEQSNIHLYAGIYQVNFVNGQEPDFNRILDRANMARNIAKEKQEETCVFYEETMYEQELEAQKLESEQEEALATGQFIVYLQPKIGTSHDTCECAEALVRWEHPAMGIISPAKFIPLFEKNHFITRLDRYVFEECCKMVHNWIKSKNDKISVSINVSKVQVFRKDFLSTYITLKEKYQIPDGMLELEFTESIFFENKQYLSDIIRQLQKNGFICSIDDFGKGYSTFGALKDLPFDIIKIDGEFFTNQLKNERERVIVRCVVNMAKDLNMRTVAEGIETLEEVDYLKSIQCDLIQGYIYSKPLPMRLFEQKYIYSS